MSSGGDEDRKLRGPRILARTMSAEKVRGKRSKAWQYDSRSDDHSKVACWTLLFDMFLQCDVLKAKAQAGHIGFGINHVMVGPINKTLDLVITWFAVPRKPAGRTTFAELAERYGVALDAAESKLLAGLPSIAQDRADEVAEVAVALEAKACMTEHIKSLPRLHAEILATGYLAKRAVRDCITASYSLINASDSFVSPGAAKKVNVHSQPEHARRVVQMIEKAVPTRSDSAEYGYDVVGITVIDCRNDGSPVKVVHDRSIGPRVDQPSHYERMVVNLCSQFRARYGRS